MCKLRAWKDVQISFRFVLGFMAAIVAFRVKAEVNLVCQTESLLCHHHMQAFNTRIIHSNLTSSNVNVYTSPVDDL